MLIIIDGVVHEVGEFKTVHPGGEKVLSLWFGKDSSEVFNGGIYNHSFAARNHGYPK